MHLDQDRGLECLFKMTHVLKKPDFFKQVRSRQSTQTLHQLYSALSEPRFTGNATLKGETSIMLKTTFFFFYILWHWWHWQLTAKLFVAFLLSQKNFFSYSIPPATYVSGLGIQEEVTTRPGICLGSNRAWKTQSLSCRRKHGRSGPAVDQRRAVGQGDVRLSSFTLQFESDNKRPCLLLWCWDTS